MKYFASILLLNSFPVFYWQLFAQTPPVIEWQRCFGGSGDDYATSIQQTFDGGYIVAGWTYSTDGQVTGNHGVCDVWVIKLDAAGNPAWEKTYGGSSSDFAYYILQSADSGYVIAGISISTDGDLTENKGLDDVWVFKIDAAGNLEWQKSLGGSNYDDAYSVVQTADGGFVFASRSASADGDVSSNLGGYDYWIFKLDSLGNVSWEKSFGGTHDDKGHSIALTDGDGFLISGYSDSDDGDLTENHGLIDYWVIKLDSNGNMLWQKSLGGSDDDHSYSIRQTADGGCTIAGASRSVDGDITGNHGHYDFWIVKLNSSGDFVWERSLGGEGVEYETAHAQTPDGGCVATGWTFSNDGEVSGNNGVNDYWIVKLDTGTIIQWQLCLGGGNYDQAYSIEATADSGYIVAGWSSSNDGDVSGSYGARDYWVVKLTYDLPTLLGPVSLPAISLYPDPAREYCLVSGLPNCRDTKVFICDIWGRIINVPARAITETNEIKIETESLPAGFYVVALVNMITGEKNIARFLKED